MKSKTSNMKDAFCLALTFAASFIFLVAVPSTGAQPSRTSPAKARTFWAPQAAADALIEAAEKFDEKALAEILGPNSYDIIHTDETARDREIAAQFAAEARTRRRVTKDAINPRRAILFIGNGDWPFPVPIVNRMGKWSFDSSAGLKEILHRRIGRNELDAIEICRGYVEAQHEYALAKKEGGVNQYAQRIISTPGQQDGLAWRTADGTWDGPIGEKVAQAIARGYSTREEPYHGYFFKVLKGQGPAAPLGELNYLVKGVMIGGFALIAAPAQYRNTGVKTFMVSQDGVVYEKDLGPKTLEIFQSIDRFNPDPSWRPVLEKDK